MKNQNIEKYLKKLNNDLENNFFDLFIKHLEVVHIKIKRYSKNEIYLNELYTIYEKAIENLKEKILKFKKDSFKTNLIKRFFQRYLILIINSYLSFVPQKTELKDLKQKIIDEFLRDEVKEEYGKIPITSQINEIRITYDTKYITYSIENHFLNKNLFLEANYFLKALELIEPDFEKIETIKNQVNKNFKYENLNYKNNFENPKDKVILLDSNIILYYIFEEDNFYENKINYLKTNNKLILLEENLDEIQKAIEFKISQKEFKDKKEIYFEKFEKIKKEFLLKIKISQNNLKSIENFYSKYLLNLEEIFEKKIQNLDISKSLRKLSQRKNLLPELDDLILLNNGVELKKFFEKEIFIYTKDIDLYLFNEKIFEEFEIKIFK